MAWREKSLRRQINWMPFRRLCNFSFISAVSSAIGNGRATARDPRQCCCSIISRYLLPLFVERSIAINSFAIIHNDQRMVVIGIDCDYLEGRKKCLAAPFIGCLIDYRTRKDKQKMEKQWQTAGNYLNNWFARLIGPEHRKRPTTLALCAASTALNISFVWIDANVLTLALIKWTFRPIISHTIYHVATTKWSIKSILPKRIASVAKDDRTTFPFQLFQIERNERALRANLCFGIFDCRWIGEKVFAIHGN